MPLPKKRTWLAFIMLCLLLPPTLFYSGFEWASHHITHEHSLPKTARNSIKHAYTAAMLYTVMCGMGINAEIAERIVISLGIVNEKIETYVKAGKKDSPAEIRKDLYNNWAGITSAKWRLEHAPGIKLSEIITRLAMKQKLMLIPALLPLEDAHPGMRTMDDEEAWFLHHQETIAAEIISALHAEIM